MEKTILITGATDGIGLLTAQKLAALGHSLLLHGRNPEKLERVKSEIGGKFPDVKLSGYIADLSDLSAVGGMAEGINADHQRIDVLINNAGILKTPNVITKDGLDIRFVVNMLAPLYLTEALLPLIPLDGRILNLSSAAQNPVNIDALKGDVQLGRDMEAYAQSKLAITMWSRILGQQLENGPLVYSVNPGSLLGTNMVKGGFGIDGNDVNIGADILVNLSLDDHDAPSGSYFDNDAGSFGAPHPDALDNAKSVAVVTAVKDLVKRLTS